MLPVIIISKSLIYDQSLLKTPLFPYFLFLLLISVPFSIPISPGTAYAEKAVFSIHLETLKDIQSAEDKVEYLKKMGHNAFYLRETVGEKEEVFKVYIERYESKDEAEKEAGVLKELGLITNYNIENIEAIKGKTKVDLRPKESVQLGEKGYYLQVGSMKEKVNAEEMVRKLKGSGYPALYRQEALRGKGSWYRIYINGYDSKGAAEKAAKELLKSGMISDYSLKQKGGKTLSSPQKRKQHKRFFFLHVSSFKEKNNAEQEVQTLNEQGLKSFFVEENISGANWFRVYIGEFDDEKAARKAGSELLKKGIISYFKPIEIDISKLK